MLIPRDHIENDNFLLRLQLIENICISYLEIYTGIIKLYKKEGKRMWYTGFRMIVTAGRGGRGMG